MTTIESLPEDLFYVIRSKCSSSIDMWHLLMALGYERTQRINLRAFWSHIRLTSLHNEKILFSFAKEVIHDCIDLRLDNLNWMITADLRRLLANFRLVVRFHTGNVFLSKSTLINDIRTMFPFLKYLTVLVSLDSDGFNEFSTVLNQIHQLEHISLIFQDKKGCLSDQNLRSYFPVISEYTSNMTEGCKFLSIEENAYGIKHRLRSLTENFDQTINLSLISSLQHLIISFRSMWNFNLIFHLKDSTAKKLTLQTLVLPCLPSIDLLDLSQLTILDIGCINVNNRFDLVRLDEILLSRSLRNLTIGLNEWQPARLVVVNNTHDHRRTNSEFSSVFENCFDQIITPDENIENPILSQPINQYSLQFLDANQSIIFQYPLTNFWLNKLTNLNLTGIHCHSTDFQHIFDALHLLQSLSLSPCLLFHIHPFECHCQSKSSPFPYEIHQLNRRLLSLNLVGHLSNPKEPCAIFLEQYKLHSIRHSSIHQHLPTINESIFHYEYLIRRSIQTIFSTLDLHHLSIRIPNYDLHINDLNDILQSNYLQTLILDVKFPVTFHTKLASLYSKNVFINLRRLILFSETHFELTPILIDRFRSLEYVEIISTQSHLNRSTIHYLETVLRPNNYLNLQTFRLWVGTVDAKHLLKHAQKIIRTAFEPIKPAFQFDISLISATHSCILYDHAHELHRNFHSLSRYQLSIIYPNFLNFKPLYSEQQLTE